MKKLLMTAMGQSCGGAQVLGVAYDPRIKTCVMLNSKDGHSGTYYEKYGRSMVVIMPRPLSSGSIGS